MQHRDVTHDVTVPPDDVTSESKMMHFGRGASKAHYHKIAKKQPQSLRQEPQLAAIQIDPRHQGWAPAGLRHPQR